MNQTKPPFSVKFSAPRESTHGTIFDGVIPIEARREVVRAERGGKPGVVYVRVDPQDRKPIPLLPEA